MERLSAGTSTKAPAQSPCLVDSNLRLLCASMRHREIEAVLFWDEQRRAGSSRGRDVRDSSEAIGILFLKHVKVAFSAADVEPLSRRIVEEIVGVADDVE